MASHNLHIESYSLEELLQLFELNTQNINTENLKKAKKKVLMLHPDKSKLGPEYFLFYKKAFDIVVQFYNQQNRQNITTEEMKQRKYDPQEHGADETMTKTVRSSINNVSNREFQQQFNKLFESNNMGLKQDAKRNEWFQNEKSSYDLPSKGSVSKQNMNDHLRQARQQTASLVRYQGVQSMNEGNSSNNDLYNDQQEFDDQYVTSDPFSKLKFDDLRKVHRDQSILTVSEDDIHGIQTYRSVDEFNRARSKHSYEPMEKSKADSILQEREHAMKEKMMQREYKAKLQTEAYTEKNKDILSSFLLLRNKE